MEKDKKERIEICHICKKKFDVSNNDNSGYRLYKPLNKNVPICGDCFNLYDGVFVI